MVMNNRRDIAINEAVCALRFPLLFLFMFIFQEIRLRLIESRPNISNELQTGFNAFQRTPGTLELRKRPLLVPGVKGHSRYFVWMIF